MSHNKPAIATACLLSLALLVAASVTHWHLRRMHNTQTQRSLDTVLRASHQALTSWTKEEKRITQNQAKDFLITSLTEQLIESKDAEHQGLIQHRLINHIRPRDTVDGIDSHDNRGFLIIDKALNVLSSNHRELIGQQFPSSIPGKFLLNTFKGITAITLPVKSQVPLISEAGPKKAGVATMFAASPIRDKDSHVIAAYVQRIDVIADFSPLFHNNRMGESGETYALNSKGILISESRFNHQLRQIGLLREDQGALLNLKLRDPGINLLTNRKADRPDKVQRLTLMAARATSGNSGSNLEGYRDYRGVIVVGSWHWDPELEIGIAVEIDRDENNLLHKISASAIWTLTLLPICVINFLLFIHLRTKTRFERLRQQQQAILDNSSSPIYIKNRRGQVLLTNEASRKMQLAIAGEAPHSADPEARDKEILRKKAPLEFEYSAEIGGEKHSYLMVKFPIFDHNQTIYAIGSIVTDITGRKQAEKALRDRERFLLSLMSNLPGLVYRFNTDRAMTANFISQGCLALTGYHPADFTGDYNNTGQPKRFFTELIAEDERSQINELRLESLHSKKTYELEYRIVGAKNVEKWVWERGRGIFDSSGILSFTEGFITDISDRKRIDKELSSHRKHLARLVKERTHELESERVQLNAIIANAADGIFSVNKLGLITVFSPSAQRITGYPSKDILNQPFTALLVPHFRKMYQTNIDTLSGDAEKQKKGFRIEVDIQRKNKTPLQADLAVTRSADSDEIHFTVIMQDITERKEHQAKLQSARDIAEEANRTKTEFLANMSHEIRTPMNAILGMTQLTLRTELTKKQQHYIEAIDISSKSLLGIINDILDFSKIEAGKLHIEKIPFSLDDVLNSLTEISAVKAQEKGLEFITHVDTQVPLRLNGDPLRLSQILLNLCSNAIKFTHKGEILLRISVISQDKNTTSLEFSVRDTGIGLTPIQQESLFQAFVQADTSITREYRGTGLGLSICQNLVHLMNGEIEVSSFIGKGSTFTFRLPFEHDKNAGKSYPLPSAELVGTRVLVVDDHPLALDMMVEVLESFSFAVTAVSSAEQALTLLMKDSDSFQLLIMDWQMPGMSGTEATRRIKQNPKLKDIPAVLMIEAYAREDIIEQTHLAGADAYLIKPINTSTLFDTIINIIGESGVYPGVGLRTNTIETLPENLLGKHIILAEDNFINQEVAKEFLDSVGFVVEIAGNGEEALRLAKEHDCDAILMDIQMPVMDGYSATQIIRHLDKWHSRPIIAMTANALPIDREKCLAAGMNDHLAKPIDLDHLLETLIYWLNPESVRRVTQQSDQFFRNENKIPRLPTTISGLDIERGLANCSNNKNLLTALMLRFADDHQDHAHQLGTLLVQGDTESARKQILTVKNMANNLGAGIFYETARELELEIEKEKKTNKDTLAGLLGRYQQALGEVLQSIAKLCS